MNPVAPYIIACFCSLFALLAASQIGPALYDKFAARRTEHFRPRLSGRINWVLDTCERRQAIGVWKAQPRRRSIEYRKVWQPRNRWMVEPRKATT